MSEFTEADLIGVPPEIPGSLWTTEDQSTSCGSLVMRN